MSRNLREEVRVAVQAALLESECSPGDAVRAALDAVSEFAVAESQYDLNAFIVSAQVAWNEAEGKIGS